MPREIHACDYVQLSFETACAVLDRSGHDIIAGATRAVIDLARPDDGTHTTLAPAIHTVTAALERDHDRSALSRCTGSSTTSPPRVTTTGRRGCTATCASCRAAPANTSSPRSS